MWPEKRRPKKSLYIVFQQLAVRSGAAKPEVPVMVPDSSGQTQAQARNLKSVHHDSDAGQGVGWPGNSICHCHHISGNAWPALVCVRMWFSCKPPGRILRVTVQVRSSLSDLRQSRAEFLVGKVSIGERRLSGGIDRVV